ncbi:MAG: hypothetical protein ACD_10C00862G0001 [uncultured bacterium]|nr:MAG: hypothetical protein ACD_10C00862G0001 [uncultured bacterium]
MALTALPAALPAVCRLVSAISLNCLDIEVSVSKALVEAPSIDFIVAAKTSPPTGALAVAFSTALEADLVKVLY